MLKRGQVAFFLIIVIVLSVIIALVNFIDIVKKDSAADVFLSEADVVKQSITTCIESVIKEDLILFAAQGGALSAYFEEDQIQIPVRAYYDKGIIAIPEISQLEEDFSMVVANTIPFCIEQSYPGFEVSVGNQEVLVDFFEESVQVKIAQDITIDDSKQKSRISGLAFKYPFSFPQYLRISGSVVESIQQNPGSIDIAVLSEQPKNIAVEPITPEFIIYTIEDTYNPLEALLFRFAVLHEKKEFNEAPFFINLEDAYLIQEESKLEVDINAIDPNGDILSYWMDSDDRRFSLDERTGLLTFAPGSDGIGSYGITIHVSDGNGLLDEKEVRIDVI